MGIKAITGDLDGRDLKLAVIVSRYNEDVSQGLLAGALEALAKHGVGPSQHQVYWVPGAMELALTAQVLLGRERLDAVICLGSVIKGDTAHFEHVATQAAAGIAQVALDTGVPVAFGVLTTYDREQAIARIAPGANKGVEAAETAIVMANLLRQLREASVPS